MEKHFSNLPVELQLLVMNAIDEPLALRDFVKASPTAATLFNKYYVDITKGVLSHTLHPQLLQLAFATMSKRVRGFEGMQRLQKSLDGGARPSPDSMRLHPLKPGSHSVHAAIDVLETAARIRGEAWAILTRLLDRINHFRYSRAQSESALERLLDNQLDAEYWSVRRHWGGSIRKQPTPSVEFEARRCSMPSWSEAFRVHRGLWRLELYREHLDIIKDGRSPFFMARRRSAVPETVQVSKFWRHLSDWEIDEIHTTLYACEGELQKHDVWGEGAIEEDPPKVAVEDLPSTLFSANPTPRRALHGCELTHHAEELYEVIEQQAAGWEFVNTYGLRSQKSLLENADSPLLKYAAMNIWNRDRLVGLGLLHESQSSVAATETDKKRKKTRVECKSSRQLAYTWKLMVHHNIY